MSDAKQQATDIWLVLEDELDDRGCFNGIDVDVMDELRLEIISTLTRLLTPIR